MVYQLADVNITSKLFVVTVCKLSLFRKSVVCRLSSYLPLWKLCAPSLGVWQDKCHGHTLYLYPQNALGVMACPSTTTVVILHGATPESKSRFFIQTQCEAASLIMLIPDNGKRDSLWKCGCKLHLRTAHHPKRLHRCCKILIWFLLIVSYSYFYMTDINRRNLPLISKWTKQTLYVGRYTTNIPFLMPLKTETDPTHSIVIQNVSMY